MDENFTGPWMIATGIFMSIRLSGMGPKQRRAILCGLTAGRGEA